MTNTIIIVIIILLILVLLLPSDKNKTVVNSTLDFDPITANAENMGVLKFKWVSPNELWFSTKLFIFLFSLVIFLPLFFEFTTSYSGNNIYLLLKSLHSRRLKLSEINPSLLLFLFIYMCVVLVILNSTCTYFIYENGVCKESAFTKKKTYIFWRDVICYDLVKRNGSIYLKTWLKPASYEPNWNSQIDKKFVKNIQAEFNTYSFRYSLRQNEIRRR